MKRLLIIDGNNLAHRAKHVFSLSNNGEDVSVIYGFLHVMISYMKKFNPSSVLVAWDSGIPKYRTTLVPSYKANRKRGSDDPVAYEIFKDQMNVLQTILNMFGVLSVRKFGSEADDIMYHASKISIADEIIVVSGDRDLLQVIDHRTSVYVPSSSSSGTLVTKAEVGKHIPVKLSSYIDWRALQGDSSDNIPGVRMVGEATATKLFETYGSLTRIIEAAQAGKLTEKLSQNILEFGSDRLLASIHVMSLRRDLTGSKLAIHESMQSWVPFSKSLVKRFFMRYTFVSMMNSDVYKLFSLENIELISDVRYPVACERRIYIG